MTPEQIKIKVIAIIVDKLGVKEEEVTLDAAFKDLGADSLDSVELILEFEKEFGIGIPDQEAEKVLTVGKAIECVEEALKNKNDEASK